MIFEVMPPSVSAQTNPLQDAQNLVNQLNPLNLLLGPAIDHAAAKGDEVAQRALEKLRAVVQEALFTLNTIIDRGISKLDDVAKNRIAQLKTLVDSSLAQFNYIATSLTMTINQDVSDRIDQFASRTGNLLAALPIPYEPFVNLKETGIVTYKQKGPVTEVLLTGVGLFKQNTKPQAYLLNGTKQTMVSVGAASMGLISVLIPNELIGPKGQTFTLKLRILRGGLLLKSWSEPTFPLEICVLPSYSVKVTVTASGSHWVKRRAPAPNSIPVKGYQNGFYADQNGSRFSFCAQGDNEWVVDPSQGDHGLYVGQAGGDHYHAVFYNNYYNGEALIQRYGCVAMYCDHRDGNANVWIAEVFSGQKKSEHVNQCTTPQVATKLLVYGLTQVPLPADAAIAGCGEAGISETPSVNYRVEVLDDNSALIETRNLTIGVSQFALNNRLSMKVDQNGLMDFNLATQCARKSDVYERAPAKLFK
jgi:hypothetical protein